LYAPNLPEHVVCSLLNAYLFAKFLHSRDNEVNLCGLWVKLPPLPLPNV